MVHGFLKRVENPEPEYVFVFTHPDTNKTAQLPKPVNKIQRESKILRYIIRVVQMIML